MRYGTYAPQFTSMRRKLWQRLVVWFGLRYNRWPKSWVDARDETIPSVTGAGVLLIDYDHLELPIPLDGGDVTVTQLDSGIFKAEDTQ